MQAQTVTFNYTGASQPWVVPPGVSHISVDAQGGNGGSGPMPNLGNIECFGGHGARVQATLTVTPGETLIIMVGGRGRYSNGVISATNSAFNGGGASTGRGGGGATDIRSSAGTLADRLLVAGGGGGAVDNISAPYSYAGAGGLPTGGTGGGGFFNAGAGATQTAGGAGGGASTVGPGYAGMLGVGGAGRYTSSAGGGGGYYGGGGGGANGGGGGGSSWVSPTRGTAITYSSGTIPVPSNLSGQLTITLFAAPSLTAVSPAVGVVGTTVTLTGSALTGATAVSFNGVPATSFTVNSDTDITATVPIGTTTGPVTVTTPGGTSNGVTFTLAAPLAITAIAPAANTRNASRTSPVQIAFNQALTTGSDVALKVFSSQRGGLRTRGTTPAVVSSNTLSYAPTLPFMPGETVFSTVTTAAAGSGGNLAVGKVVQFTTAVGGTGKGNFQPGPTLAPAGFAEAAVLGDIDGDGDLDLLTGGNDFNNNGLVNVQRNDGFGSFSSSQQLPLPNSSPTDIKLADVDGDGDLDFVVANDNVINFAGDGTVSIRLNGGDASGSNTGVFSNGSECVVGNSPYSVAAGDVDGDGDLDLLVANSYTASVSIRLNGGDASGSNTGVFSNGSELAVNGNPYCIATGDVDGDGDLDLFTVAFYNNTVSIRLNGGDASGSNTGIFSNGSDPTVSSTPVGLAVGDIDGDGDLDFLTCSSTSPGTISIRLNGGDASGSNTGVFSNGLSVAVGNFPRSVALGDVDNDGDLDLLASNYDSPGTVSIRLNGGDSTGSNTGVFSSGTTAAVGIQPRSVVVGDLDNDGDLDFVTADSGVHFNQPPAPILSSVTPNSAVAGTGIMLNGTGFTGATAVTFTGTSGNTVTSGFTSNAAGTQLTGVVVPAGATTGSVTVTTPGGTSNGIAFTVLVDLTISTGTVASPVAIPANTYRNVTITGTGAATLAADASVAGSFTVQPGGYLNTACQAVTGAGSFTLAAGATLAICDINGLRGTGNSGPVRVTGIRSFSSDASYLYNGTSAQETGSGLPATVRSLTTSNPSPVTLTLPVSITQTLTIGAAGNLNLAGQALTLLSDALGTALVVNSGPGVVAGGTVTVQRYLTPTNPGLGYRHYSSPVHGNTLADLATASFNPVFNAAYNTAAQPNYVTPFPTVLGYDQARLTGPASSYAGFDKGWYSPATGGSIPDNFVVGKGYSVNLAGTEKVDFTGTLNTGDYVVSLARNAPGTTAATEAGWALVGNPYPAPLDWDRLAPDDRPGLDASMYVFESTGPYTGSYRAYVNGLGNSSLLGSSQGFFVRVSAGLTTSSLTFRNAQRLTDYASQVPVRRSTGDTRPVVQLTLTGHALTDELFVYAEAGATAAFDAAFDAVKLPNPTGLNLATTAPTGEALAIDGRASFGAGAVIPLEVNVPVTGSYAFTATALSNLGPGSGLYLRDALAGTRTLLGPGTRYAFTTTTMTAPGRFWLEVSPNNIALTTTGADLVAQVLLYPNPAYGTTTLQVPPGLATGPAELLNSLGQTVGKLPLAGPTTTLSLRHLAAGVYTLRLTAGSSIITKRLVVE